jgi:hypothetical protein
MDKSKARFFKTQKKKITAPITKISEGINKKFLIQVNEYLVYLPDMTENTRDFYIDRYSRIEEPFRYMSPLYFASAIAFLHRNKNGPTEKNFNDKAVKEYVSRLVTETSSTIPPTTLELRRKIEFLRYIRLLLQINERLPEY